MLIDHNVDVSQMDLPTLHARIQVCPDCDLSQGRTRAVPGDGPSDASVFFVGEAPGWHEDQQGLPFVGPAGQFLDELIVAAGLRRNEVFVTNIVKCRPPNNRDPLPGEIVACHKYLDRQLELIQPQVVVTLGRYSLARFFPGQAISKVHGTWREGDDYLCFAMYHPAAALHQQSLRRTIQEDILKLPQVLAEAQRRRQRQPDSKQLSLF